MKINFSILILMMLLLNGLPMASSQGGSAAVSLSCDEGAIFINDSLLEVNFTVACTVSNPSSYEEVISLNATSNEAFTIEAIDDVVVGAGQDVEVNISAVSIHRIGLSKTSTIEIVATIEQANGVPPPTAATSTDTVLVSEGNYIENGCITSATSNIEYILFEIGENISGTIEERGNITFRLDYSEAPLNAANFALLAEMGCYNNVLFHRVINDFMVQGGDFTNGDGTGGHAASWQGYCNGEVELSSSNCPKTSWTIPDETDNGLIHVPYALSMAKTSAPHTGGSQFFIVDGGSTPSHLDGVHTVFGHVISGTEVVDSISQVSVDQGDVPLNDIFIMNARPLLESEIDGDMDGIIDINDNCPNDPNPDQEDLDQDGLGNVCDDDSDGDGVSNGDDQFPLDSTENSDTDNDGVGNNADLDDDGDGMNDTDDAFPLDSNETTDTDNDGIGNNGDADDDGDGIDDTTDNCPFVSNSDQGDEDNDGIGTACDSAENIPKEGMPSLGLLATTMAVLVAGLYIRRRD